MTLEDRQKLERRMEEWRDPFAFVPPDVCVITFYDPGFSDDLSKWKLTISSSGLLVQDITICRGPKFEHQQQRMEKMLGASCVEQIIKRADELDFWNFKVARKGAGTDMDSLRILIRHGEKLRSYEPEGVTYHAYSGDENARRFVELWNLIHAHAPFPEPQSES